MARGRPSLGPRSAQSKLGDLSNPLKISSLTDQPNMQSYNIIDAGKDEELSTGIVGKLALEYHKALSMAPIKRTFVTRYADSLPTRERLPSMLRTLVCLLVCLSCVPMPNSAFADRPPNIVVILADDLGCCDMALYDGWVKTPRIEQMAKQGILSLTSTPTPRSAVRPAPRFSPAGTSSE